LKVILIAPGTPSVETIEIGGRDEPILRAARVEDLEAVNAVVERAVMTWNLPDRVKRLAMPSYRYHAHDLQYMHVVVAESDGAGLVGVAACEPAAARDCPQGRRGLLVQGIYVDPERQRHGVGGRLLAAAAEAARDQGCDGLLVKAQADAVGFFEARGLDRLAVEDVGRDYPHRFWLDLTGRPSG